MTADEMRQLEMERKEWCAWLAGDRQVSFKLMRREPAYCVCEVLSPTRMHWTRLGWRCFLAWLAYRAPLSRMKVFFYRLAGIKIGCGVYIAPHVILDVFQPDLIELQDGCFLGLGCRLLAHDYTATFIRFGRVTVERGAVVGAYATVRGGVRIGAQATIGANSFVCRDVEEGTTVGGVPARRLQPHTAGK